MPDVRAALDGVGPPSGGLVKEDLTGQRVLSTYATVPSLGWLVFVELPLSEAYAPIYASIGRSTLLLVVLLACAILASLLAQPAHGRADPDPDAGRAADRQRRSRPAARDQDRRRAGGARRPIQPDGGAVARILRDARAQGRSSAPPNWKRRAIRPWPSMTRPSARAAPPCWPTRPNRASSRSSATSCARRSTASWACCNCSTTAGSARRSAATSRPRPHRGETLIALVDAILEYARLEASTETLEPRNFRLDQLIETAAELMRPQAFGKGLDLRPRLRCGGRHIRARRSGQAQSHPAQSDRQRHQVHRARRNCGHGGRRATRRSCPAAHHRSRYRHRHRARHARAHLRGFRPGRRQHRAAVRRHRPRACDRAPARAPDAAAS